MRVALAQLTAAAEPEANLELVTARVAEAADRGARVVVFPEATMARFGTPLAPVAQPVDGPWARAVAAVAAEHGVLVTAGMFTPAGDGRVRNTTLVTGLGEHRGYDKIHLYDAFGFAESDTVAPGAAPCVLDVDGVRTGVTTCYDIRFPELFRKMSADSGTDVVLLGASWGAGEGKREQWELLARARALDAGTWVVACGQADPRESGITPHRRAPTGIGYSLVADPFGAVHAAAGPGPELLLADLTPGLAKRSRDTIGQLANRVL